MSTPTPSRTVEPTATSTPTPVPLPPSAQLTGIQRRCQTWNNCGPATLAMALTYFDVYLTQERTAASLKPDQEDRNVSPEELKAFVNTETEYEALDRTNGSLTALRRYLAEGMPVIVELGLVPTGNYAWMDWYGHYLLVVAYDDEQELFWVYDSWCREEEIADDGTVVDEPRIIGYEELDGYWRHFNRNYIVLYRPEQSRVVAEVVGEEMDDGVMWQKAEQTVLQELNAEPGNAYLWFNLGTVQNALGNHERAAAAFDKARSIGLPRRMLYYQFGPYEAYYEVGRYDDVILLADVTLRSGPYYEETYYYKALAQIELGDLDAARENLEKAVRFNPNFSPAARALQELEVAIQ